MNLIRLLETSTFRLALIYLALFGVSALALFGFLYVRTAVVMEQQTRDTINAEITGLKEQGQTFGLVGLKQAIDRRSEINPNRASVYLLTDRLNKRIAGNLEGWPAHAPVREEWINFEIQVPDGDRTSYRGALGRILPLQGGFHLLVGRDIENLQKTQSLIQKAIGWGLGLTLLLGLAGGFLMSRGMLSRIDAINRTTRRIMAGDLGQRISLKGSRDEFDVLAGNLNAMLDQIERLLSGMREVTDNIAHDLRTPLSRMRSRIEVALLANPDRAEARDAARADPVRRRRDDPELQCAAQHRPRRGGRRARELRADRRVGGLPGSRRPVRSARRGEGPDVHQRLPARPSCCTATATCWRRRWPICSTTRSSTRRPAAG